MVDFDFFGEKIKNHYFSETAGFLGYKLKLSLAS